MSNEPIIIIGAPRSGTTILGDILSSHPDLHYFVEPTPLWRRYAKFHGDFVDREYTNDQVRKTRTLFEKSLRESGKRRILEKTPQNCLRVPFVYNVFPNAKYVHIVRDGYESSLSILKHWETNTSGFKGVRIGQRLSEMSLRQAPKYAIQLFKRLLPSSGRPRVFWGPILPGMSRLLSAFSLAQVSAIQWKTCVEQACYFGRKLPKEQYMEVRLEELDANKVREIIGFVGLSQSDEVDLAFETKFKNEQTSYRRAEANDEVLQELEPWVGPTQTWLENDKF
jgi:hypothetical protein